MKHLLAFCLMLFAAPVAAGDKLSVMLDWFVNPDHAPIIVAQQTGMFADAGLDVEIIAPADPADPPKLAAAGKVDLAISYQPQLHLQQDQGLPLLRVGTLVATPLYCVLVKADAGIEDLSDLRGKTIGYSIAGIEEALLFGMLSRAGVAREEVTTVNVNFSLSPSILAGQVDAVSGAFRNFELHQMAIAGAQGRCFYPEENGIPTYDELIYVANPDRMDPARIARFLAVTERATAYILNHPDAAWEAFKSYAPELDDTLNARAWGATLPRFALRPAALDGARYKAFDRFLKDAGLIKGDVPLGDLAVDLGAK